MGNFWKALKIALKQMGQILEGTAKDFQKFDNSVSRDLRKMEKEQQELIDDLI